MIAFTIDDSRVEPCPTTGCWLWTGNINEHGYGRASIYVNGASQVRKAHRLSWERHRSPIPVGMVVDHICRERSCVNPDHLRVVTQGENATLNSLSASALNKTKACCSKCGSAFTGTAWGKRRCDPCDRKRSQLRYRQMTREQKDEKNRRDLLKRGRATQ